MKIVASIECRMTSTRLPGKVLMNALDDMSMLEVMIKRVQKSKYIDSVILATTINEEDEVIVDLAKKLNIDYYRGSEHNVLDRVVKTHESVNSDIIVELTGDCPVIDPLHVDDCIKIYLENNFDYVSNSLIRSFPDGCDVQVFSLDILSKTNEDTSDVLDQEHVSKYIYECGKYTTFTIEAQGEYYWPELGVTLDTKEDYDLLKNIFTYFNNIDFDTMDYIKYLKQHPNLLKINQHIQRKGLT